MRVRLVVIERIADDIERLRDRPLSVLEGGRDIVGSANFQPGESKAERAGRCFEPRSSPARRPDCRALAMIASRRSPGDDLAQEFEPLAGKIGLLQRQAGDVAARPRKARDQSGADRVSPPSSNTIGMTDVACFAATTGALRCVTMTSTFSRTNSAAISAKRSLRPSAQRYSIAMVRPSIQPSSRSRCTKAAIHGRCVDVPDARNPMVGSFCCARAANGRPAVAAVLAR